MIVTIGGEYMKISTKGRYALRVMIDLAEHDNGEYITLMDMAERQGISEKYLESIVSIFLIHFVETVADISYQEDRKSILCLVYCSAQRVHWHR